MKRKAKQEIITLRDFFAGMALAGLRALSDEDAGGMNYKNFSVTAFKQADSMLIERKTKWRMQSND